MSTFVQLCRAVARESGTVPTIGDPATVTGQTGRLARIVAWVNLAYTHIQNEEDNWGWLFSDFSGAISIGLQTYEPAVFGLSRFARWSGFDDELNWTIYKNTDGVNGEGFMTYLPYDEFRRRFFVGTVQSGKPQFVSVNPRNEIVVGPKPDVACTIKGQYQKGPQSLAADGDIPEMPERFHNAILWKALIYLGTFDEAMAQIPNWNAFLTESMSLLRSDQLPQVTMAGPLA